MVAAIENEQLGLPAIAVHGGAGARRRTAEAEAEAAVSLSGALEAGWRLLSEGGAVLDAVVEAVAALEDGGAFNAGRGAVPADDGIVEFDAGVMDGTSGLVGAICASTFPANPIRVARAVAERGGVPDGPVLLAGVGADEFARRNGLLPMRQELLVTPGARIAELISEGTVGAVAVDGQGNVAAATSTGGRSGQVRGRVGDSPIPGAGVFATEGVALSATGTGEAFLVAGFAHLVAGRLKAVGSLSGALEEGLAAVAALSGSGGAIALTPAGELATGFTTEAMARAWRGAAGTEVVHPA